MTRAHERGKRMRCRRRGARSPTPPPPPSPPPPEEAAPPFAKVTHILFQLSTEGRLMVQNYRGRGVHNNIMSEIVAESARENQGVPQLWKKYPVELIQYPEDPRTELLIFPKADVDYTIPLYEFMVPILPKSGFFVLLMRAPSTWGQRRLRPDVKLLYRKSDMYLQGFFHQGFLYLFSDSDMSGVLSPEQERQWVKRLPFKGSYGHCGMEVLFDKLNIGPEGFLQTYSVLSLYESHTMEQVMEALARMAVCGSEAIRFPIIFSRIEHLCLSWNDEPVNPSLPVNPNVILNYSGYFHDWMDNCDDIFGKEHELSEKDYRELLQHVAVLKRRS